VEQRAAQSFANRRLVRGQVAGASERDRRLMVVARLEQLGATPVELVDVVHGRRSL